jgi:hypothetical protein
LVTSADASKNWDPKVELREKLTNFIYENSPVHLLSLELKRFRGRIRKNDFNTTIQTMRSRFLCYAEYKLTGLFNGNS